MDALHVLKQPDLAAAPPQPVTQVNVLDAGPPVGARIQAAQRSVGAQAHGPAPGPECRRPLVGVLVDVVVEKVLILR